MEIQINYVFHGHSVGTAQGAVAIGQSINTGNLVTNGVPTGYSIPDGTDYTSVARGQATYDVTVEPNRDTVVPAPLTVATVTNGSETFALGTKWYEFKTHADGSTQSKYLATDDTHLNSTTGLMGHPDRPTNQSGYWCVTGNKTDGYSFYNRDKGPSKVFAYTSETRANLPNYDNNQTGIQKKFDFVRSNWANYYCLRKHNVTTGNRYINISGQSSQNYRFQFWTETNDNNSAWTFTEVGMEIAVNYKRAGITVATKQYAVAVGTSIETAARSQVPNGYAIPAGATFATVTEGTFTYDVNVNSTAPDSHTVLRYVDENGTQLNSVVTYPYGEPATHIMFNSFPDFYNSQNFQLYEVVSVTDGTNTYRSMYEFHEAVGSNAKDITIKLRLKQPIKTDGTVYVINNFGRDYSYGVRSLLQIATSENIAQCFNEADGRRTTHPEQRFTFEDAGNGKYYIRNVHTGAYLQRPEYASGTTHENKLGCTGTPGTNNEFYISNAVCPAGLSGKCAFALADAVKITDPVASTNSTNAADEYFLYGFKNYNNVVRGFNNIDGDSNNYYALWSIEEWQPKPHTSVHYKLDIDGVVTDLTGVTYTPNQYSFNGTELQTNLSNVTFRDARYQVMNVKSVVKDGDYRVTNMETLVQHYGNTPLDGLITITLTPANPIDPDKWYTIGNKHFDDTFGQRFITIGTAGSGLLLANTTPDNIKGTHFYWRFVPNDDGTYYIKNLQEASGHNRTDLLYMQSREMTEQLCLMAHGSGQTLTDDNKFWVTNACTDDPNVWAIVAYRLMPTDPTTAAAKNTESFIGNHYDISSDAKKNELHLTNPTAHANHYQWDIQDAHIHPVDISFVTRDWDIKTASWVESTKTYADMKTDGDAGMSISNLVEVNDKGKTKILSCFTNISFTKYYHTSVQLNDETILNRKQFYDKLHAIDGPATMVLYVSEHDADEVDLTLDLFCAKGMFKNGDTYNQYADRAVEETGVSAQSQNWKLEQISHAWLQDLNFELVATDGSISDTYGVAYADVPGIDSEKRSLNFDLPTTIDDINEYHLKINNKTGDDANDNNTFYILQYELKLQSPDNNSENGALFRVFNEGNAEVTSERLGVNNVITDSPCSTDTWFKLQRKAKGTPNLAAAPFFRVRIVNGTYIKRNWERAATVCTQAVTAARNGKIGYPNNAGPDPTSTQDPAGTANIRKLEAAYNAITASGVSNTDNDFIEKYRNMVKAYSAFISCRDLNLPEDCKVYNFYMMDENRQTVLLGVDEDGNLALKRKVGNGEDAAFPTGEPENRWITHKDGDGHLVLINKATGTYFALDATDGPHLEQFYDAAKSQLTVAPINADASDYMESATDENLLGAVYLRAGIDDEENHLTSTSLIWDKTVSDAADKDATVVHDGWLNRPLPRFGYEAEVEEGVTVSKFYTSALRIEEVDGGETYTSITLNPVDGIYWGSYVSYFPIQVPTNAEAYYVTNVHDGWFHLEQIESDVILPNFPVIIRSEGNKSLYEELSGTASEHLHIGLLTGEVYNGDGTESNPGIKGRILAKGRNLLQGKARAAVAHDAACQLDTEKTYPDSQLTFDTKEGTSAGGFVYVLNKGSRGVGFYRLDDSVEEIPAGKAYYVHPEILSNGQPNNIRGFIFTDDKGVETRVEFDNADSDATIYDLSGRRIDTAKGGVYIINGKKVVNKK